MKARLRIAPGEVAAWVQFAAAASVAPRGDGVCPFRGDTDDAMAAAMFADAMVLELRQRRQPSFGK